MSIDCYCDYDPPQFYRQTLPKARKEHRCGECNRTIRAGETYERTTALWYDGMGVIETLKTCQHCLDLRNWVTISVPCFCWCFQNMIEDAKEAIEEAWFRAGDEVAGLRFGFGRKLVAIKRAKQ